MCSNCTHTEYLSAEADASQAAGHLQQREQELEALKAQLQSRQAEAQDRDAEITSLREVGYLYLAGPNRLSCILVKIVPVLTGHQIWQNFKTPMLSSIVDEIGNMRRKQNEALETFRRRCRDWRHLRLRRRSFSRRWQRVRAAMQSL